MNGIFHWRDALAYFGPELDAHRPRLECATQATYGLLACRSTPASAPCWPTGTATMPRAG
ncbi:MAG: hypothetical protein H6R26_291 [Proteobacteria bacterium]|nr:hypothetical protein [Pseudomonadota bacterium]